MARERDCKLCEGTGFLYLMNSWFHHGGYRRSRCGLCAGTGKSNYNPSADYVAQMKRLRCLATGVAHTSPQEKSS